MTFTLENCKMLPKRKRASHGPLTSKYLGVSINRTGKRYRAVTRLNGKYHYIGTFDTQEEAAYARDAVIRKHDLPMVLNFPDE